MRALTEHAESCFFESGDGSKMVDTRQLGHELPQQFWINHLLPRNMCQGFISSKPLQLNSLLLSNIVNTVNIV